MDNDYTISAMTAKQVTEDECYFDGKHFEGHGNKWNAVFGDTSKFLINYLKESVAEGEVIFEQETGGKKYAGLIYPNTNEPISIMSLIELGEEQNVYASSYPLLKGINNDVILKDTYMWEVKGEGEMAAEVYSGNIINFFNPYFAIDNSKFKKDKVQTISLSALAFHIDKLEEKEFEIDKGAFYEVRKKEFLENNPDKTEKDFEPPVVKISAERFRMFIPSETTTEYEIATQIEEIEHINVFDEKFIRMKVNFGHTEEDEHLYCNIYASSYALDGYEPKVGDGITGFILLMGFFN